MVKVYQIIKIFDKEISAQKFKFDGYKSAPSGFIYCYLYFKPEIEPKTYTVKTVIE